jgi:hypothetical protein
MFALALRADIKKVPENLQMGLICSMVLIEVF